MRISHAQVHQPRRYPAKMRGIGGVIVLSKKRGVERAGSRKLNGKTYIRAICDRKADGTAFRCTGVIAGLVEVREVERFCLFTLFFLGKRTNRGDFIWENQTYKRKYIKCMRAICYKFYTFFIPNLYRQYPLVDEYFCRECHISKALSANFIPKSIF